MLVERNDRYGGEKGRCWESWKHVVTLDVEGMQEEVET